MRATASRKADPFSITCRLPSKPFIPKRGEKDYEPRPTGSSLQQHMLEKARKAMYDAIGGVRGANRCALHCASFEIALAYNLYLLASLSATQYGSLPSRARTLRSREASTSTRSACQSRATRRPRRNDSSFCQKRPYTSLNAALCFVGRKCLISKAISLARRCQCSRRMRRCLDATVSRSSTTRYASLLTFMRADTKNTQVYAYLKRLGYNVLRTRPPIPPVALSWWRRLLNNVSRFFTRITHTLFRRDWWSPRISHGWGLPRDYGAFFAHLLTPP